MFSKSVCLNPFSLVFYFFHHFGYFLLVSQILQFEGFHIII